MFSNRWGHIFAVLMIFGYPVCGQQIAGRARVYDRGLVSAAEPFSPTGNPALLSTRDYLRFNFEYYRDENTGYQISMSYPISSRSGIGLAWRRLGFEHADAGLEGLNDRSLQRQDFLISLGHDTEIQWGQVVELNYENYQHRIWNQESAPPSLSYQQIQFRYRIGILQSFGKAWKIGLMTPPLLAYRYRAFGGRADSVITTRHIGREFEHAVSMPLLCVEWQPAGSWGFALSNRSYNGRQNGQLAVQWRKPRWDLLQAACYNEEDKSLQILSGVSVYLQGFQVFAGYDFSRKYWGFSASFVPERMRALIRISEIRMNTYQLYPYRLIQGQPEVLASILVERASDQPVELALACSGEHLPPITQSVSMNDAVHAEIKIPMPPQILRLPPGRYRYQIELTAYSKGKQTLAREISFEVKSSHDWSGDPQDLVYFLRPQHQPVMDRSRRLIALNSGASAFPAEWTAERFYRFITDSIHYVPDPRPIHNRSDRGQYPAELLKSKTGDCEDLSILMISMLQSVGIDASFAEYVRPDTDEGHIFILFDSGKTATQLLTDGKNLQRYIVRVVKGTRESRYFVPLELTRHDLSFEASRMFALEIYQLLAIEQNGLVDGWFHIIDAW